MSTRERWNGDGLEAELKQALGDFKASVDAWSEAAYNRPRTVQVSRHWSWRLAAGWALGCVLVGGSLTGGVFERHHRQELARAAEQAHQQKQAAEEQRRADDEDLLATVDSDVSRQVPSAMEPLAQLMDEDTNQ